MPLACSYSCFYQISCHFSIQESEFIDKFEYSIYIDVVRQDFSNDQTNLEFWRPKKVVFVWSQRIMAGRLRDVRLSDCQHVIRKRLVGPFTKNVCVKQYCINPRTSLLKRISELLGCGTV